MIKQELNNYAYIDGANLHNGIASFGWKLDYARFRVWLTEKYKVSGKLKTILSPHTKDLCSILLKRTDASITYINDVRLYLEKEKAPDADKTA